MKSVMRWLWRLAGAAMWVGLAGCTSIRGIRPIHPGYGEAVPDLQPVLAWSPSPEPGVTYDLLIYDLPTAKPTPPVAGEGLYVRANLAGTSHRVEVPLKPGTVYKWCLRTHQGSQVGDWNKRTRTIFIVLFFHHEERIFTFKTPPVGTLAP